MTKTATILTNPGFPINAPVNSTIQSVTLKIRCFTNCTATETSRTRDEDVDYRRHKSQDRRGHGFYDSSSPPLLPRKHGVIGHPRPFFNPDDD